MMGESNNRHVPPLPARIRIRYVDGRVEERSLDVGSYRVGRIEGDIVLDGDRNVSRQHARLELLAGLARVLDLHSTCGTFTEYGQRLEGVHLLKVGESVRMGNSYLTLLRAPPGGAPNVVLSGTAVTQQDMPAIVLEDWEKYE